jgi:negative regulator of sigma E activity
MKKLSLTSFLAASALLCGVTAVTPLVAQNAKEQNPAQPTAQADPQAGQMQQATKVFTGKITKDGDRLVLKDTATNMTYQLDDQSKAKKYEGKEVKVTGSFDANSNTIHVESIEAAAS